MIISDTVLCRRMITLAFIAKHLHGLINCILTGQLLKYVNPIPLAMSQINDLAGAGTHWQSLYTILTELFVNALRPWSA